MIRVLITGGSGTGKSAVTAELAARGHRAIDTDYDDWHEWVEVDGELDWVWREDRMHDLLASDEPGLLFVSGTSVNQGKFYPRFHHVVLLSAPTSLIVERLRSRTNNPYGKNSQELARVLEHIETVEPLLRQGATAEIRTDLPIEEVMLRVLEVAGEAEGTG